MNSNTKKIQRDGAHISLWQSSASITGVSVKSAQMQHADCLIVGAGITGVTTAYLLAKSGKQCILVDAHQLGFGTTGGTTAHLNTFFDATYPEIEKDFGADAAQLVALAGKESIRIIHQLIKELNIECDFEYKDAWLFAQTEKEGQMLEDILEASKKAGVDVESATEIPVPLPFEAAVRFKNQAQFHPLKYTKALLRAYVELGGVYLDQTTIRETTKEKEYIVATADAQRFKVRHLVYATHVPPGINLMSVRNAPYRSYVLGLKLKQGNYPMGLAYDMKDDYHYFRTHEVDGEKYLILGGEDHKTGHGDPEESFQNLLDFAQKYYDIASVDFKWSSQYYVPVDGLPYIGQLPGAAEGILMATGYNGNGMIFGTLSATILSDLILGRENKYADLFKPSRLKPIAGFTDFVKENADVAWRFVADRFSTEQLDTLNELEKGQGRVVIFAGEKIAVYKDENGKTTILNPTCTHMGCIVDFNSTEKSWDCPCHGGRFDICGKVLTGPPTIDLEKVDL